MVGHPNDPSGLRSHGAEMAADFIEGVEHRDPVTQRLGGLDG
jgi:hypothetical protein